MHTPALKTYFKYVCFGVGVFLVTGISLLESGCQRGNARVSALRANDLWNIRTIGQASVVYASDHNDQLPSALDVWDYAQQLVGSRNLSNEAGIWQSRLDPAADSNTNPSLTVFSEQNQVKSPQLNPAFLQFKPSIAVVIGKLNLQMPVTTPIAWTRGLQSDGTWAKFSPYGTTGGFIAFMGGNVRFYRNIAEADFQIPRFDGKGKTSDILEALPPGSRVGEYVPTAEEKIAWTQSVERQQKQDFWSHYFPPELWLLLITWLPFISLAWYRTVNKTGNIARVFVWPALLTLLEMIFLPVC